MVTKKWKSFLSLFFFFFLIIETIKQVTKFWSRDSRDRKEAGVLSVRTDCESSFFSAVWTSKWSLTQKL